MPHRVTLLYDSDVAWLTRILYPELARFPGETEAREALRNARAQLDTRNSYWLMMVLLAVIVAAAVFFVPRLNIVPRPALVPVRVVLALALVTTGGWCVMLPYRNAIRKTLRRQLAGHDVQVCVECGYDLSQLAERRCPECGTTW